MKIGGNNSVSSWKKQESLIKTVSGLPKNLALVLIKGYKILISPLLPSSCRFYPTCSQYAFEAIQKYGFLKGSFLGLKRILKCHPFHPGGHDPIP